MIQEYRIYKPTKAQNGAASKWQLSKKETSYGYDVSLFVELAPQTGEDEKGNARFAWRQPEQEVKSVTMMLNEVDVGAILAVLDGNKEAAGMGGKGLYHQNEHGNSILKFSAFKDGFYLGVSSKRGDKTIQVKHSVSMEEGKILGVLLRRFIEVKFAWV